MGEVVQQTTTKMVERARSLRLRALIVQPPDFSTGIRATLGEFGFVPLRSSGIIDATMLMDVAGNWEAVMGRLSKSARWTLRRSERAGLALDMGGESDLPLFYKLMLASCRRQGAKHSNPASVAELRHLWSSLLPGRHIWLALAKCEGQAVAGLLCICFGNRLTLWKKGWDGSHGNRLPNESLTAFAYRWANANGLNWVDLAAIDRAMGERILTGKLLTSKDTASRYMFYVRLGGRPQLLPQPLIWFPNRTLRRLFYFSQLLARGLRP